MDTKDFRKNKQLVLSVERMVNIGIFLIGLIVVGVGIYVFRRGTQAETISISVGASMMASAIVAFMSSIYIRKYRAAKELAEYWGLTSIEERRETMNLRIDEVLEDTRHQYDIMAYGLKSLRESKSEEIAAMLKRGARMRIITVDPEAEGLKEIDRKEKKPSGSTSHSITQMTEWARELDSRYPGQCQIKFSSYLPSEFYCRQDGYIYTGPYQYGRESQRVFTMEYKQGGAGFDYYERYFESLWTDSEYCAEKDFI